MGMGSQIGDARAEPQAITGDDYSGRKAAAGSILITHSPGMTISPTKAAKDRHGLISSGKCPPLTHCRGVSSWSSKPPLLFGRANTSV